MVADRAVDGYVGPEKEHCAHPDAGSPSVSAWWQVDLGDDYVIDKVTIVNAGPNTGMYVCMKIHYTGCFKIT